MDTSDPVVRKVSLRCPPESAFSLYTERIGQWWPRAFTASGDNLADVVIEGRVGGRVYESDAAGGAYDWGIVTAWEPGRRVVQSWTLGMRTGGPTEVEVRFSAEGDGGASVFLEHRGWGADQAGDRARFADDGGWTVVLDAYRRYAEG
jgi:uncharacterized protein YndB with AHSA1/START domain